MDARALTSCLGAATLRTWKELPAGRRALTFAVSALPAAIGAALVWRLDA